MGCGQVAKTLDTAPCGCGSNPGSEINLFLPLLRLKAGPNQRDITDPVDGIGITTKLTEVLQSTYGRVCSKSSFESPQKTVVSAAIYTW